MDDKMIQGELETLAVRMGMTIRYEPLKIDGSLHTGGYCRIRGQDVVIINKKASTRDKIHVLTDALRRYELKDIYVLPSIRQILGEKGE